MSGSGSQQQVLQKYIDQNRHYKVLSDLFDKQLEVVLHPSKRKNLNVGRRGGKTHLEARYLAYEARRKEFSKCLFLTDTREHAKDLIWEELGKASRTHGLDLDLKIKDLTCTDHQTGSKIKLGGLKDTQAAQRYRGYAFDLIIIDEAGSIPDSIFEVLVKEVLGPTLRDYGGTILLSGTPAARCSGFFHQVSTDKNSPYKTWNWTVLDNPNFPAWRGRKDWREFARSSLEDWRTEDRWNPNSPGYLREWLALWVPDVGNLIYYIPDYVIVDTRPPTESLYTVLSVDLGYKDHTGYAVIGYDVTTEKCYELESQQHERLTLTEIVNKSNELATAYNTELTVVDPAAGGTHLAVELRATYGMDCITADKQNKVAIYRMLNDSMRHQKTHLLRESELRKQMSSLRWNADHTLEEKHQVCDMADAFLYGWRHIRTRWPEKENPKTLEQMIFDRDLARHQQNQIFDESYELGLFD